MVSVLIVRCHPLVVHIVRGMQWVSSGCSGGREGRGRGGRRPGCIALRLVTAAVVIIPVAAAGDSVAFFFVRFSASSPF